MDLPAEEQIRITDSIGFDGIVVRVFNTNHVDELKNIKNYASVKNGRSKILAAYLPYDYENLNSNSTLQSLLEELKDSKIFIWLVLKSPKMNKELTLSLVKSICKKANRANVDVVLYPHDRSAIESAEEALEIMEKVDQKNLFLSIHLNHELRYGNGTRLGSVIKKTISKTKIVGISGANNIGNYNRGSKDWSDVVQPLRSSAFDVKSFYRILLKYGYDGPFVLQNYGIPIKPQIHLSESLKVFREWTK